SSPLLAQVGTPQRRPSKTLWHNRYEVNDAWLTKHSNVQLRSGQTQTNRPKILHGSGFFAKRRLTSDIKTRLQPIQKTRTPKPQPGTGPLKSHDGDAMINDAGYHEVKMRGQTATDVRFLTIGLAVSGGGGPDRAGTLAGQPRRST